MANQGRETSVRDYLTALKNPSALRDESAAKKLEEKLAKTTDPVERVTLQQQLLDAQKVDMQGLEAAFTKHAKAWADAHGVTAQAFRDEGVPPRVLRSAGFTVRGGGRATTKARGQRRERIPAEEIRKRIKAKKSEFTVADIAQDTGASTATVRKVVNQLLEAGELHETGQRAQGRGRAATTYNKK
jgi:hypothetical protein